MAGIDMAVDLGTATLKIYAQGRGIVTKSPAVVAYDTFREEVIAVGKEAYAMLGRTSERVEIIRPVIGGVISNFSMAEHILRHFVKQIATSRMLLPRVVVSVPYGITEVQKRAVVDAICSAGARKVCLIEEPVAAAMGAGVEISAPHGNFVVDIGAGTTDMAMLSLNGIAIADSIPVAGDAFNEAITRYVRRKYNMVIGQVTAEAVKINLGQVYPGGEELPMEVKGRDAKTGSPRSLTMTSTEVFGILQKHAAAIADEVTDVLSRTSPELVGDIAETGITLTGGCAQISGMAELIMEKTQIPCVVADDPASCAAYGCGKSLSWINSMKEGPINIARKRMMHAAQP
jgi:rod shape-determining protein MreB